MKIIRLLPNVLNTPLAQSVLWPPFMRDIDFFLLTHYPRVWVTKLHYVIFYCLPANVLIVVATSVFPIKLSHITVFWPLAILLICVESIFIFIWIFQQLLFNVEKQFGDTRATIGLPEVVAYVFCIGIILMASITFTLSFKENIGKKVTEIEFMRDAHISSEALHYNLLPYRYSTSNDAVKIFRRSEDFDSAQTMLALDPSLLIQNFVKKYTGSEIPAERILRMSGTAGTRCYRLAGRDKQDCERTRQAPRNAESIFHLLFDERSEQLVAFYYIHLGYLILGLLLFAYKHINGWSDAIFALAYMAALVGILATASALIVALIDEQNWSDDIPDELAEVALAFLVALPALIMLSQVIRIRRLRRYSRFGHINLTSLPFGIVVATIAVILIYWPADDYFPKDNLRFFLIPTIAYLVSVPIVKAGFIKLIALPRE